MRRRTTVFAFPQQMAGLRDLLAAFVTEVFAATRFDRRSLLRGVYFTSGTQEGTPIDRLMAAIGRGFARRVRTWSAPGRARQGVLHRAVAQGRADRGVGARRRQPARGVQKAARAARRLRRDGARRGARRHRLVRQLRPQPDYIAQVGRGCRHPAAGADRLRGGVARGIAAASRRHARGGRLDEPISTTTSPGRCAGGSIKERRSAMPRAMPTCASSTASCCRDSPPS